MRGHWLDATETEITTIPEVRLFVFIQQAAAPQHSNTWKFKYFKKLTFQQNSDKGGCFADR